MSNNELVDYESFRRHAMEIIFLVEESKEGGYEARALGHAIFSQGETMEELKEMVADAVRCHFDERDIPRIVRLHYVREEVFAL